MQQRITPTINVFNAFTLTYPAIIAKPAANATPSDNDQIVRSSIFLVDGNPCRILNEQRSNVATNKLQVVESGTGTIIVDNIGSFSTTSGLLTITAFRPTGLLGGSTNIKISVIPANQSAIAPERQNIIKYDEEISTISVVTTEAEN